MIHSTKKPTTPIFCKKGVEYYNIDNRDKRDNKDKTLEQENVFLTSSVGVVSDETLSPEDLRSLPLAESQERGALLHLSEATAPTPLDADQIERCVYQLFDNGADSSQRYKFKIRLNLTDKTNPEFIASLTKDFRNFKKYIPESNRDEVIAMAQNIRKHIKEQMGTYPYIGKLHFNQGAGGKKIRNQVEPNTFVAVWWNEEDRGWSGIVKIQNWIHEFDLFTAHLTSRQVSQGVKCQDNWINPKYDKTVRPLTWAQKRGLGL